MTALAYRRLAALLALAPLWACETSQPTNPTMSFAAPLTRLPADGTTYDFNQQQITLVIANAVRTGSSAVNYQVEVATDAGFASRVFTRDGIAEGAAGTTSVQLPALAGDTTYYWRWRASVDTVTGEPSAASRFTVRPNVVLQAPLAVAPPAGSQTPAARPVFTVQNAARTGSPDAVFYEFQLSASGAFGSLIASATVQEQANQTSWTPAADLPEGTVFWRVRASAPSYSVTSAFSATAQFERTGFAAPGDQIDLRTATVVLGVPWIAAWPATSTVTSAAAGPGVGLCIHHTKLGAWPRATFFGDPNTQAEGNQWIFANIGGHWVGGSGHWYRPGQGCKDVDAHSIAGGTFYQDSSEPIRSWVPRIGETFAVMSATPARFYPDMRTVDERTNVVLIRWGG